MDPNEEVKNGEVTLKSEQYDALLDRLAELEAVSAKPAKRGADNDNEDDGTVDLESLANEGKRSTTQKPKEEPIDLDSMTNTQLFQFIMEQGDEMIKDIRVGVEALRLMREIDKAEVKHTDFWQYEQSIRKLCIANPKLTVEQAYRLASSDKPPAKEKGDDTNDKDEGEDKPTKRTRSEKILNLPPRQSGDKPGPAVSSTKSGEKGISSKEAAEKAWEEVVGRGKTEL